MTSLRNQVFNSGVIISLRLGLFFNRWVTCTVLFVSFLVIFQPALLYTLIIDAVGEERLEGVSVCGKDLVR